MKNATNMTKNVKNTMDVLEFFYQLRSVKTSYFFLHMAPNVEVYFSVHHILITLIL